MSEREPESGAIYRIQHTVGDVDLAAALPIDPGQKFPAVFATSRMIALMELAGAELLKPLLGEGELSVGVGVNVEHLAPTPPGARVWAEARYVGREGKLYVFEVRAGDPAGEVGRGRHTRAIVSTARLEAGAAKRGG